MNMPEASILIAQLTHADIDEARELARLVWHKHYPSIISTAQIDYMLAQRYSHEVIAAELRREDIWWHKAMSGARMLGFSACLLTDRADELKLDKLYVHNDAQRRGIGGKLIGNAARLASPRI
jgi:diamine N-acetyltransferase